MSEEFVRLSIPCPVINCRTTQSTHNWRHATDGNFIEVSNRSRFRCSGCLTSCDIRDCTFACNNHSIVFHRTDVRSFMWALSIAADAGSMDHVVLNSLIKGNFTTSNSSNLLHMISDNIEILYSELEFGNLLGSGGFKTCYAGKYKGKPVAIGKLHEPKLGGMEDFMKEVNIHRDLWHPNVVRFMGVCTNSENLCIIMELCDNGDLSKYMKKVNKPSKKQQITFMHDIALGVAYLHSRKPNVIHRDLKPQNILITSKPQAKVNDFGLVRVRFSGDSVHSRCGTQRWKAPEFLSSNSSVPSYNEKVDVYACGLIFWEIMTWGKLGHPYDEFKGDQLCKEVKKGTRPPMGTLSDYPRELLKLVEKMWHEKPIQRPSMENVVRELTEIKREY